MPEPKSCVTCTLCARKPQTESQKKAGILGDPIISTANGIQVVSCTRKAGPYIALNIAKTQAVCLEDPQPVLPEHTHCQDITPTGEP